MTINDIIDFLPNYPDINSKNFYDNIYKKKELYDNKLDKTERKPVKKGDLMKHQKIISRFLSSKTPYNSLLLVHEMGTGKTCSAIGAIEQIKSEKNNFKGALYLAKGNDLINNFIDQCIFDCTDGKYIPENYDKLSADERTHRKKKAIKNYYSWNTFQKFAKEINKTPKDESLRQYYNNMIIVIDEVHNLRIKDKKEGLDIYKEFYRFLHVVENCKILLLSGTPMKDNIEEIASIMNLILPEKEKKVPYISTGDNFISEFFNKKKDIYKFKTKEKEKELKDIFKGRISFLNSMQTDIEKKIIGKPLGTLKYFNVEQDMMSKFQSENYIKAYKKDIKEKGIYSNSRQASLFVFPDGSYGSKGFNTFIKTTRNYKNKMIKYSFKSDKELEDGKESLKYLLVGKNNSHEKILKNLKKYSSKYTETIKNILKSKEQKKCMFVYNEFVKGSGLILFSLILELFAFKKAIGSETSKQDRYAILTSETTSSKRISNLLNVFNNKKNMNGEVINVILGSKKISEGFSFKNIQIEEIHTPWFNYSETSQAIARGLRLFSHKDLTDSSKKKVMVEIFQRVSIPFSKEDSDGEDSDSDGEDSDSDGEDSNSDGEDSDGEDSDGEDSDSQITIEREVKKIVFKRIEKGKRIPSIDLQMYEWSEKKDINIKMIENILKKTAIDCALNYNRNYIDNPNFNNQRECYYSDCDYECYEVNDNKTLLQQKELDFSTYQLYYNNLDIVDIINSVLKIFRKIFKMNLSEIIQSFSETSYTIFEILSSLNKIINQNIQIINKFGFVCYLREQNNIFFLIDNLIVESDFFSEYYTEFPNIKQKISFKNNINSIYDKKYYPGIIDEIFKDEQTYETIQRNIYKLPLKIQEKILESSLLASKKNIKINATTRDKIIKIFESTFREMYFEEQNITISSLLYEKYKILRCLIGSELSNGWKNCNDKQITNYKNKKSDKSTSEIDIKIINNKYGYYGIINPKMKEPLKGFCIRNVTNKKQLTEKGNKRTSGMICTTKHKNELLSLLIKTLKIPIDFDKDIQTEYKNFIKKLKTPIIVSEIKKIFNSLKLFKGENVYNEDEKSKLTVDEMTISVFWHGKRISDICNVLKKWFIENNLITQDFGCGRSGGPKPKTIE